MEGMRPPLQRIPDHGVLANKQAIFGDVPETGLDTKEIVGCHLSVCRSMPDRRIRQITAVLWIKNKGRNDSRIARNNQNVLLG